MFAFNPNVIKTTTENEKKFLNRLIGPLFTSIQYKGMSVMPMEVISKRAEEYLKENPESSYRDELAKSLLKWFRSFFKWWHAKCPKISSGCDGKMKRLGGARPNEYEKQGRAGIVEVYQCKKCQSIQRFPRYNHCYRLLETKTGRCGEYAQAFCCLAASLNFDVRYCIDWTDHVWAEIWSDHLQKWVHCDSCERRFDTPLMYETGWKKKLTYVIAFSKEEVVDVTKKYSRNWEEVLKRRRNNVSEEWLSKTLKDINEQINIFVTPQRQSVLRKRRELDEKAQFLVGGEVKREEMGDRESGDTEWKKSRGEFRSKFKPENHVFVWFRKGNKKGIRKKIIQFSKENLAKIKENPWFSKTKKKDEGEEEEEKKKEEEEEEGSSSFEKKLDALISIWSARKEMSDQDYEFLEKNLLWWDMKTVFPVLDLLRLIILNPTCLKYMTEKRTSWFSRVIEIWSDRKTVGKHTFVNSMMISRICCNMFETESSRKFLMVHTHSIVGELSKLLKIGEKSGLKDNYRKSYTSLFFNLSLTVYRNSDFASPLIRMICGYMGRIHIVEARKMMILSLGVLSYEKMDCKNVLREKKIQLMEMLKKDNICMDWVLELEHHLK